MLYYRTKKEANNKPMYMGKEAGPRRKVVDLYRR